METDNFNHSYLLYENLINSLGSLNIGEKYSNQLQIHNKTLELYEYIYLRLRRNPGQGIAAEDRYTLIRKIPGLDLLCKECMKYYLNISRTYAKSDDIAYAKFFENSMMAFLNRNGIRTVRGDDPLVNPTHHSGYPDLMILGTNDREVCYCEIKYNAAPFIKVSAYVPGRECYEGSLTLNPQKLERQRLLIQSEIKVPVYYVYWADFPCLKGVFFTEILNIWKYYQSVGRELQHDRKTASGDFAYGRKKGQTEIIYPPVLEMNDFNALITTLRMLSLGDVAPIAPLP